MHSPRTSRPRAAERASEPHPAVLRSSTGGHPLPAPVQAKMEGALGHDFGSVRVHHGPGAGAMPRSGFPARFPRAGGGAGVIQPLMDKAAFGTAFGRRSTWMRMRSAYADPTVSAIEGHIHAFHNVPAAVQAQGEEAVTHHRMAQLHAAEHHVYAWHNTNRATPAHPQMAPMSALLRDIQLEHRTQVKATVDKGHALWTPDRATMSSHERGQMDDLWRQTTTGRSATGQRSRLSVSERSMRGNAGEASEDVPGFKNEVDALHARLMTEPHGRNLLRSVVRGRRTTTVRPNHSAYQADFASAEVGTGTNPHLSPVEEVRAREAFAIDDPHAPGGIRARGGAASRVGVNRDLSDVALQHWDTNSGDDGAKTGGSRILSPAFLIYAHELGHVQHNQSGTNRTNVNRHLYDSHLISQRRIAARLALGPMTAAVPAAQQLRSNWDNAEEHENIENVENPLRAAHGLSARKWH